MNPAIARSFARIRSRLFPRPSQLARVPLPADISAVYAIGDVHGHLARLQALEQVIADDLSRGRGGRRPLVVMLGDYVDRGPDSAGVLAHLAGTPGPAPRLCLRGNHEALFLDFLDRPSARHDWLQFGGRQTLLSYGLDIDHLLATYRGRPDGLQDVLRSAVPAAHRAFLGSLPVAAFTDDLIFAHAGIRPGLPLEKQSDHDLLWIREPFLSQGSGLRQTVVHGHTVQPTLRLAGNRLGIDMGVQTSGRLIALRIGPDGIVSLSG
ncbi:metallophosphoesterase family protein [Aureimonas sp. SK2]|uniref:metallophosphoesterase family protein n=1 Tax=Aureimonas sp. SK2 TaxID=3015992 RepID=UPI0024444722|nr:metallophosphoesterase family protein [Aureimonas sp. SK2]